VATRHRTIDRVAAILEQASADPDHGVSLAGIATALEAPKSSIHGLLNGLLSVGYLVERDGRYVIGPGLGALLRASADRALGVTARRELERLNAATEETVLLGVQVGSTVVYTDQLESPHLIRYAAPIHQRRPLLTTSMGKVFLADMDERQVRRIARGQTGAEVDVETLLAELDEVRHLGYSTNHLEMRDGITALAAGVRDADGRLAAAIAVRGPTFRMSDRVERCAQELLQTAAAVSALVAAR
jgi:DNA-binding IclR family transcriptional regulator